MKVDVEVNGSLMRVECGKGGQSTKWLAMVAAQRLAMRQPHGRGRLREPNNEPGGGAMLLPNALVMNGTGVGLRPSGTVRDEVKEGQAVALELRKVVELDEVGCPITTSFYRDAFCLGEAESRAEAARVLRMTEKIKKADCEKRRAAAVTDDPKRAQKVEVEVSLLNFDVKQFPQHYSSEKWPDLSFLKAKNGGGGVSSFSLKSLLRERFDLLKRAHDILTFRGLRSITCGDFSSFIHTLDLLHAEEDEVALSEIFRAEKSMTWAGSLGTAMVRALQENLKKNTDDASLPFEELFRGYFENLAAWLDWREPLLRKIETSILINCLPLLERIYEIYAGGKENFVKCESKMREEKEEEENHHNYISLEHFTGMMEECEVLDVDLSETSLECFRWVQREPENDSQVLRKLPFSDAVLAMSHMCFLVLGDSMPYEESIHLMVDALLELAL